MAIALAKGGNAEVGHFDRNPLGARVFSSPDRVAARLSRVTTLHSLRLVSGRKYRERSRAGLNQRFPNYAMVQGGGNRPRTETRWIEDVRKPQR